MKWFTLIPLITSSILTLIGILSFLINSRYTFENARRDQLYRQRESIRAYGIAIISTIQSYTNAEIEYLNQRFKIDTDIKLGKQINPTRSQYVYSLKQALKKEETNLKIKILNSNLEISTIEFNDIQKEIIKTYQKIKVFTKNLNIDNVTITNQIDITIIESQLNGEMKFLLRRFRKAQNDLTDQILVNNFYKNIIIKLKKIKKIRKVPK